MADSVRLPPPDEHRLVAGGFTEVVEGTATGAWDNPAPVEGWAARDVVRHLVEWSRSFLASSAAVELPEGPSVDDDPVGAWRIHAGAVQALLDDPATAGRTLSNPHTGDLPLDVAIDQFYTGDVFMHTWDLARATGQDETLDSERCAAMLAGMEPIDEALRASGQYGPKIDVPADADVQTRLLAFIGRDPR
ncbi:MAG: TIGR03086 family protein [Acidimicrobiia bacterium]|nr:TIGR03086 family protein [Acidimicrobiia bacterium]